MTRREPKAPGFSHGDDVSDEDQRTPEPGISRARSETSQDAGPRRPPVAPRRAQTIEAHGDSRTDYWSWLRDSDNPEVLAHLRAENAYADAELARLDTLRAELFEEIRSRIAETDVSAPTRYGPWWYYDRTEEGLDYPIHCRVPASGSTGSPDASDSRPRLGEEPAGGPAWPGEVVVLDENLLAEGHNYLDVGTMAISPDHSLLAYGVDHSGEEHFTIHVRDLLAGADLADVLEDTSYGLAWSVDSQTLFYTRTDSANRPFQLWRHSLGEASHSDVMVMEEPDERFHMGVGTTKDGAFVVVMLGSKITSEVWLIDASSPHSPPRLVCQRRQGVEYSLEHHSGTLLVLTNDQAPNFRLMAAPVGSSGQHESWTELIAERPEVRLEGFDVFVDALLCAERFDANPRIVLYRLEGDDPFRDPLPPGEMIEVPEDPSSCYPGWNPEISSPVVRFEYSSLATPRTVYELDRRTGVVEVLKRQRVLGDYDPSAYVTERLWVPASGEVMVPVSVVRRRDVILDGSAPCLLYGYGAYEISIDPVFSSLRLSLLDRGFVFAIAHVRGGGELGRRWYEDGKLLAKPHSFEDFVAVARHLVEIGYTSPDRLAARGGSAGGLLMGAVANMAPELFRAIVAEVPFVDCLNTMLDPSLPLTVIEWEEWGNPAADRAVYETMKTYAPYENVRPDRYPDLYVTAGLGDPRVGYFEPAKWVQKLRAANPDNRVIFKVEMDAGHAGPSGRYEAWRDEARVMAFLLDALGAGADRPGS